MQIREIGQIGNSSISAVVEFNLFQRGLVQVFQPFS